MSIQANFPTARPSLLLDFANTKSLDPRITYSRAGVANYYDGKTAVMAEQNLFTYSEQFDNAAWTKSNVTVTANSVVAPNGNTTADTLTETTATGYHDAYQLYSMTASTTYTLSNFVKNVDSKYVGIAANFNGSNYAAAIFDITTGVVVSSAASGTGWSVVSTAITYVGNGWYRYALTFTVGTSGGSAADLYLTNSTTISTYGGPAPYAGTSRSVYFWGAQLEQRSTVSAYTATTASAITNYIPTLQSAASGVPRFDSNPTTGESLGLLIEESRTNVLLSSQFVDGWTPNGSGDFTNRNVTVAPDGTTTSAINIASTVTTLHGVYRALSVTAQTYTFSVFAKQYGYSWFGVSFGAGAASDGAFFDLANGVLGTVVSGTTASISSVGNGWYRCSITRSLSAGTAYPQLEPHSANGQVTWAGNGYSGTLIWGAQLEAGTSATSYVATPLTFTSRASSATYLGPNGYITSAATNVARNQTNSVGTTNLLLEAAASNLFQYTEDFANSYWTKTNLNIAVNQTQSPDGLVMADAIVETTATGQHNFNVSFATTGDKTLSIYAKQGSGTRYFRMVAYNGSQGNRGDTYFDLTTGVVSSGTGTITSVGGGWYRCTISFNNSVTDNVYLGLASAVGTYDYAGNGSSSVYIWGAQVEAGSTATSYIPSVETWSSRASTATYYNSSGVLATAASGASRTTYNPALLGAGGKLLLEPAATNVLLYSEQFDNGNWAKANATVTANATTAPDGNATADKLISNNGVAGQAYQSYAKSPSPQTYTATVYAKAAEFSWLQIAFYDGVSDGCRAWFNLASGTTGTTAGIGTPYTGVNLSIQSVGSGWYRCSLTATTNSAGANVVFLYPTNGDGASTTGNGTSGIYIWGAQCETGSGPTSYIATTTTSVTRAADASTSAAQSRSADVYSASTVTRAADAASMTGTNFSSWYRQDEGTFYVENKRPSLARGSVSADDGTSNNCVTVSNSVDDTNTGLVVYGGTTQSNVYMGSNTLNFDRFAVSYKSNDVAGSQNNGTVVTDSSVTLPTVTTFRLGIASAGPTQCTYKKIAYYPQRLTNTQLQALTS